MVDKSRHDVSVYNNSKEMKTVTVKFVSKRGRGKSEWERTFKLQGLNSPNKDSGRPTKTRRRVNFGRPGSYLFKISTKDSSDSIYIKIGQNGLPDNIELNAHIKPNNSV